MRVNDDDRSAVDDSLLQLFTGLHLPFGCGFLCHSVLHRCESLFQFTFVDFHGRGWIFLEAPKFLTHFD